MTAELATAEAGRDFIRDIVQADLNSHKHKQIVTRFPPEPNGYLHIGHAKSIALNFGIAQEFAGRCHLRFDDTNPTKEEQEYIDSIQADVKWLGYDWGTDLFYASDYFERLYGWAEELIRAGHAYVDDQSQEEIRLSRGTLTEPGRNSPFRERSVDENLDLFRRMKAGEFPNGARVLRAKIDMSSGNINLRDPVLYRILHAIRAPAANGRSIRAMTTPMASPMRSRASRIRSARWSSRITVRSTNGCSTSCRCRQNPVNTNSRGSI
jgi:glutaminyl-tRNA synthetase